MKPAILSLRKSINKSFLKVKPYRPEIEAFKQNLIRLIDRIDESESEEFHKNVLSEFLKDTFYSPDHYINTRGRFDLVIHTGKDSGSPVGVLLETKKPGDKTEMPSKENLNTKAFHELLLYYLRERITANNLELKYLIATDTREWYIFNASEFEKLFAGDKSLVRQFRDFEEGRLSGTTTDFFYKSIAEPFIRELDQEISVTHIDIREYERIIRNDDRQDDNKLIALYKIFSPGHLLKLPFINDSNTLDKSFYSELLHIIGLKETKEGSKKLIGRRTESERYPGSLIENTINILQNEECLSQVKTGEYGSSRDEQLYHMALELVITWINRILFLKLLEGQLLRYNNGEKEFRFLNTERIRDYDTLNKLFFQVLAVKEDERNEQPKQKFRNIPYLNSSLFEPDDLERRTIRISNLDDEYAIPILNSTVLRENTGKRVSGKMNTLQYLFAFLDAYDFASEGSEEIQEENKTLINASVLGLIFEKINGYKDGSFFTPGFITMYMCRETIRRAVVQKFNDVKGYNCETLNDVFNKIGDEKEANRIINSLKICDPAVGSGHFLVSALNEIIAIKSELKILLDRDGRRLKHYHIEVANDELVITDEDGELFEYNPKNKESQQVQEALFHEKQTIIENCLFGVDINPNSVKICRLRLWIELLKNAYYITPGSRGLTQSQSLMGSEHRELETLPNIDINIKCGNSLISRYPLDADIKKALRDSRWSVDSYRIAIMTYRNAQSKDEKREMEKLIEQIKNDFESEVALNDKRLLRLNRLKGELTALTTQTSMFEKTKAQKALWEKEVKKLTDAMQKLEAELAEIRTNKIYENAFEWRFEFPEVLNDDGDFVGFDVVIGNPPYIYNRDIGEQNRIFLKDKFQTADDLYVYFTCEGLKILKQKGFITLITPNTYFTLSTRTFYRSRLLENSNIKFTNSGFCFEDAYVETMIYMLSKEKSSKSEITFVPEPGDYVNYTSFSECIDSFINNLFQRFFIPTSINKKLNEKFNKPLKSIVMQFIDVINGKVKNNIAWRNYSKTLKPGNLTLLGLISEGEQGLVTGNNSKYIGRIIDSEQEISLINKKFLEIFNQKSGIDITLTEFSAELNKYCSEAEELKKEKKDPNLFGRFFLYKCITNKQVKKYNSLSKIEKVEGGDDNLWVYYNRGNSEGYKWFVPYAECINWSAANVSELKAGIETNSRWQGEKYFNVTGFGWVDYFTDRIKSFFVEAGIYSKNIVKFHSINPFITNKFIVAMLNSKFISYYVKNFITTTHTLQINDGRLIPLIIPNEIELEQIENFVDQILVLKKQNPNADTTTLEAEIDRMVYELYGLTDDEIRIVEGAVG